MAFVTIDTFVFKSGLFNGTTRPIGNNTPDLPYTYTMGVQYDSASDKFRVTQHVGAGTPAKITAPPLGNVSVAERGKNENQEISFSCSGTSKISFQATLSPPFVKRVIVPNSTSCGYVAPAPPPVCDLMANVTNQQPTFGNNDGTITVNLTTVNTGFADIKIYKDGVLIDSTSINLNTTKQHTFTGLSSGNYTIVSSLTQFACTNVQYTTVPEASAPPPPVCDLTTTATSTGVTYVTLEDGTITVNLSTINTGIVDLKLYKGGVEIVGKATSINLSSTNTHTFTGLKDGEYIVKSSLQDYECISNTSIIVDPAPTLVCDLIIATTSTNLSGLNTKDGTIKVDLTTANIGNANISLLKDGAYIDGVVIDLSSHTFTFTGLDVGNYTVLVSLADFLCKKQTNAEVLPMSFNEKYYFEFCEQRFGKRPVKVSIKKKNYSGATTKIKDAQPQVALIEHKADNDYKFNSILGSSCDLNFISNLDFEYADLFICEEQENLVEIYTDGLLSWTGYLTGDRATEDFKNPPYQVTLSALDGIKLLKNVDFDVQDRDMSFLEAIKYCLDKTNLSLPFKTLVDISDVTKNVDYRVDAGLKLNAYGDNVVIDAGVAVVNGVLFDLPSKTILIPQLPPKIFSKDYYIYTNGVDVFLRDFYDPINLYLGTATRTLSGLITTSTRVKNFDSLNDHIFNTNNFLKDNGEFTDCLTVLESIARQFTSRIGQAEGYWFIENIGSKARLNLKEYTYDRDLNLLSAVTTDFSKDIDCSQGINKALDGGNISLITGDKRSIVHWKLGYPKPIFGNNGFESWGMVNGAEIPAQWQVTTPYGWFNKGSKFDRIYDPTTGVLTEVENGSYYFNIKPPTFVYNSGNNYPKAPEIKSTDIIVFNQEVVSISFQVIITNKRKQAGTLRLGFIIAIGNYVCVNFRKVTGTLPAPVWELYKDDNSFFALDCGYDETNFNPFGDEPNVTISLPPAPVQGFLSIRFNLANGGDKNTFYRDYQCYFGFDNFKVTKTSPVTNVKTIEDATIIVENGNKFSNVPDEFEVVFGDVETDLRTDGIRTLNHNITQIWQRIGVEENEALNNILAKELLSQYQVNSRIFEGQIMAENMSVRNYFNLPTLDLFRFVPSSFSYDLIRCIADVSMFEVYAEDGLSSGSIGGGSGGSSNVIPKGYILASKNSIFTDGNDNLLANGI